MNYQRLFRTTALALSLIYFWTNILFAHAPETSFWTERNRSRTNSQSTNNNLLASLPSPVSPIGSALGSVRSSLAVSPSILRSLPRVTSSQLTPLLQSLPYQLGTVKQVVVSPGPKIGKVVLHIQDIHLNKEAQMNIAGVIQKLSEDKQVGLVALEGAFETVDVSRERHFADRGLVRDLADYLLEKNLITGPVHTAMTSTTEVPPLVGVDDKTHYAANVESYRASWRLADSVKKDLGRLERTLDARKASVLNPALKELDARVQAYHKDQLPLGEYVKALTEMRNDHHSALRTTQFDFVVAQFLEAYAMEKTVNYQLVERERDQLLKVVVDKLSDSDVRTLVDFSLAYRMGNVSHADFYTHIQTLCAKNGLSLARFPALQTYIQYVLLSDGIDSEKLLAAVQEMEEKATAGTIQTAAEKQLIHESRALLLAEKLVDYSLTPEEWNEYKRLQSVSPNPLVTLSPFQSDKGTGRQGDEGKTALTPFEAFYEQAELRNHALVQNVLKAMDAQHTNVAVLVTGGFHTPGLTSLLQDAGATTITFAPKISHVDSAQGASSLSVFAQDKLPLDELFKGEKLFLGQNPVVDPVTRGALGAEFAAVRGSSPRTAFQSLSGRTAGSLEVQQTARDISLSIGTPAKRTIHVWVQVVGNKIRNHKIWVSLGAAAGILAVGVLLIKVLSTPTLVNKLMLTAPQFFGLLTILVLVAIVIRIKNLETASARLQAVKQILQLSLLVLCLLVLPGCGMLGQSFSHVHGTFSSIPGLGKPLIGFVVGVCLLILMGLARLAAKGTIRLRESIWGRSTSWETPGYMRSWTRYHSVWLNLIRFSHFLGLGSAFAFVQGISRSLGWELLPSQFGVPWLAWLALEFSIFLVVLSLVWNLPFKRIDPRMGILNMRATSSGRGTGANLENSPEYKRVYKLWDGLLILRWVMIHNLYWFTAASVVLWSFLGLQFSGMIFTRLELSILGALSLLVIILFRMILSNWLSHTSMSASRTSSSTLKLWLAALFVLSLMAGYVVHKIVRPEIPTNQAPELVQPAVDPESNLKKAPAPALALQKILLMSLLVACLFALAGCGMVGQSFSHVQGTFSSIPGLGKAIAGLAVMVIGVVELFMAHKGFWNRVSQYLGVRTTSHIAIWIARLCRVGMVAGPFILFSGVVEIWGITGLPSIIVKSLLALFFIGLYILWEMAENRSPATKQILLTSPARIRAKQFRFAVGLLALVLAVGWLGRPWAGHQPTPPAAALVLDWNQANQKRIPLTPKKVVKIPWSIYRGIDKPEVITAHFEEWFRGLGENEVPDLLELSLMFTNPSYPYVRDLRLSAGEKLLTIESPQFYLLADDFKRVLDEPNASPEIKALAEKILRRYQATLHADKFLQSLFTIQLRDDALPIEYMANMWARVDEAALIKARIAFSIDLSGDLTNYPELNQLLIRLVTLFELPNKEKVAVLKILSEAAIYQEADAQGKNRTSYREPVLKAIGVMRNLLANFYTDPANLSTPEAIRSVRQVLQGLTTIPEASGGITNRAMMALDSQLLKNIDAAIPNTKELSDLKILRELLNSLRDDILKSDPAAREQAAPQQNTEPPAQKGPQAPPSVVPPANKSPLQNQARLAVEKANQAQETPGTAPYQRPTLRLSLGMLLILPLYVAASGGPTSGTAQLLAIVCAAAGVAFLLTALGPNLLRSHLRRVWIGMHTTLGLVFLLLAMILHFASKNETNVPTTNSSSPSTQVTTAPNQKSTGLQLTDPAIRFPQFKIQALIEAGRTAEAKTLLFQILAEAKKGKSLEVDISHIGLRLAQVGEPVAAREAFHLALDKAEVARKNIVGSDSSQWRAAAERLGKIAFDQAQANYMDGPRGAKATFQEAIAALDKSEPSKGPEEALNELVYGDISSHMAHAGLFNEARDVASRIKFEMVRNTQIEHIANIEKTAGLKAIISDASQGSAKRHQAFNELMAMKGNYHPSAEFFVALVNDLVRGAGAARQANAGFILDVLNSLKKFDQYEQLHEIWRVPLHLRIFLQARREVLKNPLSPAVTEVMNQIYTLFIEWDQKQKVNFVGEAENFVTTTYNNVGQPSSAIGVGTLRSDDGFGNVETHVISPENPDNLRRNTGQARASTPSTRQVNTWSTWIRGLGAVVIIALASLFSNRQIYRAISRAFKRFTPLFLLGALSLLLGMQGPHTIQGWITLFGLVVGLPYSLVYGFRLIRKILRSVGVFGPKARLRSTIKTLQSFAKNRTYVPVMGMAALPSYNNTHQTTFTSQDITTNPGLQADMALYSSERFNMGAVSTVMDLTVEHEAILLANGITPNMAWGPYPQLKQNIEFSSDRIRSLNLKEHYVDPEKYGRMPAFIETVRKLKNAPGQKKPVVVYILGPYSLAARLLDEWTTLQEHLGDPELMDQYLEYTTKVVSDYAEALVKAGADMVVICDPTSEQLIPVEQLGFHPWRRYIVNPINAVAKEINNLGGAVIVHTCKRTDLEKYKNFLDAIIGYWKEMNVQGYSISGNVPLPRVHEELTKTGKVVMGNIQVTLLEQADNAAAEKEAARVMKEMKGRNFIPSFDCDASPVTPPANFDAVARTISSYVKSLVPQSWWTPIFKYILFPIIEPILVLVLGALVLNIVPLGSRTWVLTSLVGLYSLILFMVYHSQAKVSGKSWSEFLRMIFMMAFFQLGPTVLIFWLTGSLWGTALAFLALYVFLPAVWRSSFLRSHRRILLSLSPFLLGLLVSLQTLAMPATTTAPTNTTDKISQTQPATKPGKVGVPRSDIKQEFDTPQLWDQLAPLEDRMKELRTAPKSDIKQEFDTRVWEKTEGDRLKELLPTVHRDSNFPLKIEVTETRVELPLAPFRDERMFDANPIPAEGSNTYRGLVFDQIKAALADIIKDRASALAKLDIAVQASLKNGDNRLEELTNIALIYHITGENAKAKKTLDLAKDYALAGNQMGRYHLAMVHILMGDAESAAQLTRGLDSYWSGLIHARIALTPGLDEKARDTYFQTARANANNLPNLSSNQLQLLAFIARQEALAHRVADAFRDFKYVEDRADLVTDVVSQNNTRALIAAQMIVAGKTYPLFLSTAGNLLATLNVVSAPVEKAVADFNEACLSRLTDSEVPLGNRLEFLNDIGARLTLKTVVVAFCQLQLETNLRAQLLTLITGSHMPEIYSSPELEKAVATHLGYAAGNAELLHAEKEYQAALKNVPPKKTPATQPQSSNITQQDAALLISWAVVMFALIGGLGLVWAGFWFLVLRKGLYPNLLPSSSRKRHGTHHWPLILLFVLLLPTVALAGDGTILSGLVVGDGILGLLGAVGLSGLLRLPSLRRSTTGTSATGKSTTAKTVATEPDLDFIADQAVERLLQEEKQLNRPAVVQALSRLWGVARLGIGTKTAPDIFNVQLTSAERETVNALVKEKMRLRHPAPLHITFTEGQTALLKLNGGRFVRMARLVGNGKVAMELRAETREDIPAAIDILQAALRSLGFRGTLLVPVKADVAPKLREELITVLGRRQAARVEFTEVKGGFWLPSGQFNGDLFLASAGPIKLQGAMLAVSGDILLSEQTWNYYRNNVGLRLLVLEAWLSGLMRVMEVNFTVLQNINGLLAAAIAA